MWTLASQSINKEYYSGFLTRSFMLSTACCIFAFVVPILILVSIGYSWNKYSIISIQPQLTYQNHQISCLLADSTLIYDSTFTNQLVSINRRSFLGVGGDQNNYAISANIMATNVVACSMLVYFRVTLSNLKSLAVLPLQITASSSVSSAQLSSISQTGIIYTKVLSAIPQSSVGQSDFTSYYYNSSQILNMNEVHRVFNAKKNVTLIPTIVSSTPTYASATSSLSYLGNFYVPNQQILQQVPIITNLRTFIPYFIYLFILTWIFIAQPTVRWMLQNKIYQAKVIHPKIKYH